MSGLKAGQTPRFIFPNGPYESRASVIEVNKRYKDEFKNPKDGVSRSSLLREGALPHIKIGEIKVRWSGRGSRLEEKKNRPFSAAKGFRAIVHWSNCSPLANELTVVRSMNPIASRIESPSIKKRLSEKATPRQAALDTLKMILCSPSFLYLSEITAEDERELRPFDLASRLSYALWAAPPDDELSSPPPSPAA